MEPIRFPSEAPCQDIHIGSKDYMKSLGSGNSSPTLTSSSLLMNTARLNATSIMSAPPGFFKRQDKDRDKFSGSPSSNHKSTLLDNGSNYDAIDRINHDTHNNINLSSDDGGGSEYNSSNEVISTNSILSTDLDEGVTIIQGTCVTPAPGDTLTVQIAIYIIYI